MADSTEPRPAGIIMAREGWIRADWYPTAEEPVDLPPTEPVDEAEIVCLLCVAAPCVTDALGIPSWRQLRRYLA